MLSGNLIKTVGTGLMLIALYVGENVISKSQAMLFLAGQVKIALGQTEEGMQLLNRAANNKQVVNTPAEVPAAKDSKCTLAAVTKPLSKKAATPQARSTEAEPQLIARAAMPKPVFANFVDTSFMTPAQAEQVRIAQEIQENQSKLAEKMRHLNAENAKKLAHMVHVRYMPGAYAPDAPVPPTVPTAEEINRQVQLELQAQ